MQPDRTIRRARRLRKTPTRAEEFFWSLVRVKAVEGLGFRRRFRSKRTWWISPVCRRVSSLKRMAASTSFGRMTTRNAKLG
jgi:very-short-patch-repair endonuclease